MPLWARGTPGDTPSLVPTPRVMEGCSLSGRLWAPALAPRSNTILCAIESSLFGDWCGVEHEGASEHTPAGPLAVCLGQVVSLATLGNSSPQVRYVR